MNQPLVSIIVPLYKSTAYLEALVSSVVAQTYPDWELILVDDCSPDETYSCAQKLATQEPRIQVLQHDKNYGSPAFGRNTGIAAAKGEFITFLDHDDSFEPTKLADNIAAIKEQQVDFLVSNGFLYNERSHSVDGKAWSVVSGDVRTYFARRLLEGNFVPPNCVFIRATVFAKTGVFDTALKGVDDYDMWYRIARTVPAGIINKPLATWRYQNNQSISADDTLMIQDELAFYRKVTQGSLENTQAWEKERAELGARRCLKRLGHRALAAGHTATAKRFYQEAQATRFVKIMRTAPQLLRLIYATKRFVDRIRHKEFRPLILQFGEGV